jgi:hypothetical protein
LQSLPVRRVVPGELGVVSHVRCSRRVGRVDCIGHTGGDASTSGEGGGEVGGRDGDDGNLAGDGSRGDLTDLRVGTAGLARRRALRVGGRTYLGEDEEDDRAVCGVSMRLSGQRDGGVRGGEEGPNEGAAIVRHGTEREAGGRREGEKRWDEGRQSAFLESRRWLQGVSWNDLTNIAMGSPPSYPSSLPLTILLPSSSRLGQPRSLATLLRRPQ